MSTICRLCLSNCDYFVNVTENSEIPPKIESCVSIQINKVDTLPKTVCESCLNKVNSWFEFKEMCHKSEALLKNESLKAEENSYITSERMKIECEDGVLHVISADCLHSDYEDDCAETKDEEELDQMAIDIKFQCLPFIYNCEYCPKEFDTCLDYLDHQDLHEGEPVFKCEECVEIFTNKLELVQHEKNHKIACEICGKKVLPLSMKLHLITHTDRYQCPDCSHRFSCNSSLEQHIITVHTDQKNHVCENCGKRFSSKTALSTHAKTHKEKREYKCKVCDYEGRTASAVYIHMSKHLKESHSCEICGKIFKSYRNLYDHLKRVHTKEKKHECSHCGIKFIQKYMLTVHLRTHSGVRPYECTSCDKTFIRSDSLKEHMLTHGPRTIHACPKCLKKFMTKRGRERHNCTGITDGSADVDNVHSGD